MVKEKKILSYFVGWLILGYIICFIGISNVFADTYENIGYLNDYSDVLVEVSYTASPLPLERTNTYQLEQVDAMNIHVSNFVFSAGITYSIEFSTPNTALSYANAFTVTGIDSNNNSVSCATVGISYDDIKYLNFKFNCSSTVNELHLRIFNSSNDYIMDTGIFSWSYVYLRRVTRSTDTTILESQNSQIIQGQQDIKDTIKDELNSCRDSYNLFNINNVNNTGANTNYTITENKIKIEGLWYVVYKINGLKPNTSYTFSGNTNILELADKNTTGLITIVNDDSDNSSYTKELPFTHNTSNNTSITIYLYADGGLSSGSVEFSNLMLNEGTVAKSYESYGEEICSNKIDETNDKLDGIQGAITDTSSPDTSGLENSAGWLPPGPLDSILNLPLTMLNSLTNSLGKTCFPLILTLPYVNKNLEIPCLSSIFAQITGVDSLWTWVGTIASVLILYNYLLNLYAWVDRVLTLRAEFDEAMGADLANWGRL